MGTTQRKWDFFDASCKPANKSLSEKKKQGKNRTVQRHEQVLPPAAASRESMQGIKYKRSDRVPMGGGGGNRQKSSPKLLSPLWGFVFESAGSSNKKKGRQTARPQI
jgi:hypothetical protein